MITSRVLVRGVSFLIVLVAVPHPLRAQRDAIRQPPLPSAVVRGHVTIRGGNSPLRGAEVRAGTADGNSRLTTTDANGQYELRDLPSGRWTLTASKAGFVSQQFQQRRPREIVQPIEIANGQVVTADFALMRGGALAGHVFDEFGDAVAGARVQVLLSRMIRGTRRLEATGGFDQTDDLGAFRLYGLGPGDYYVSASMRATPLDSFVERSAGAPTFFPGTSSMADAQRIALGPGEEKSNIDFALAFAPRTVRVSGTIVDSRGVPAAGAGVNLLNVPDWRLVGSPYGNFGQTQAEGTFAILNVPSGTYVLSAMVRQENGPPEEALMPITVGTDDLPGVTVVTTKPSTMTGRIGTEDRSVPAFAANLRVRGTSTRGAELTMAVAGDGTFRLPATLGRWAFAVEGLPGGWALKSFEINGADVADSLTEFTGSEREISADVVVTSRLTEVSGTATINGQPASDVNVVVFSDDPSKWGYPSRYVRSARTNDDGRFSIVALPPDRRYRAVVVEYVEESDLEDPEFLQRLRDRAATFALEPGAREQLTLTLRSR